MKLRNKKTGETRDFDGIKVLKNSDCTIAQFSYDNLAELNEEWEDYEEPKSLNEIDAILDAIREYCNEHLCHSGDWEKIKILNTIEEKLMAWKRLKDKGFRFTGHLSGDGAEVDRIYAEFPYLSDTTYSDLDLLFGGKE